MKKNRVNEILIDQTKRRQTIFNYACVITVISILVILLLGIILSNSSTYEVGFKESSNIDYKVLLKENEFFDKSYLEKDNQYIASLIHQIYADFNYHLEVDEDNIDYNYKYRIEAEVNVKEKNSNKSLYNKIETIQDERAYLVNDEKSVNINEHVKIDYNRYNDLIKRFINVYDLDNIVSTLTINMYVSVIGSCEEFTETTNNDSVVSLVIPLTTKTVGIDIFTDLAGTEGEYILICKNINRMNYFVLLLILIAASFDVYFISKVIRYIIDTRTAETIYERELKKILNNYRSYIQKINNEFDLSDYQVLKVDTFTDMLEIRDTIQEPILMAENKDKTITYFLIPSKTKILYSYELRLSEIKKQLQDTK